MAKKSFFSRIAKALAANDNSGIDMSDDMDIADIDRDIESAVQAIKGKLFMGGERRQDNRRGSGNANQMIW